MTTNQIAEYLLAHPEILGQKKLRRVDTHISTVLLGEDRVFKFKKPVKFPFLSQAELSQRRDFCEAEVRLNRRLSRDVYLGVRSVVPAGEGFALGESEDPAGEPVVEMRYLDESWTLKGRLERGRLSSSHLERVGAQLADFHATCDRSEEISLLHDVESNLRENLEVIGTWTERIDSVWRGRVVTYYETWRQRIEARELARAIVDGHGDLRLDHIYVEEDGGIQVLDCVEFSPALRAVDPYEDLAFATMGLRIEGAESLAQSLALEYAYRSGDAEGFALLPFYELYRASVRAKIDTLLFREGPPERREHYRSRFLRYARFMEEVMTGGRSKGVRKLIVTAGLPATGKTTYARELSRALGLPVLSTDVLRKRQLAISPEERAAESTYSDTAKGRIYEQCAKQAEVLLRSGHGLILDGTYARQADRGRLLELADRIGCPVEFHELTAPEKEIRRRLEERRSRRSVSDLTDFDLWRRLSREYEPFPDSLRESSRYRPVCLTEEGE